MVTRLSAAAESVPGSTVKLRRDAVDPATVAAEIGWLKVKVNIGGQGPVQGGGWKSIPTNVAFLVYETRGKVMYQNRSINIIAIIIVAISVVFSSRFIACVSRACRVCACVYPGA